MTGFHELVFECDVFQPDTFEGDDICEIGRFIFGRTKRKKPEPIPPPDHMKGYGKLSVWGKKARLEAIMKADPDYYREKLADEYGRILRDIEAHGRLN